MFPRVESGLSLVKVISGISKTLNVAQQIIPIYEQTKPMISKAKEVMSLLNNKNTTQKINKDVPTQIKKTTTQSNSLINNPAFFQ